MHTKSVNQNNFAWQTKLQQFTDANNKYVKQTHDSALPKAENSVKDFVELSADGRQRAREAKDPMEEMVSNYQILMNELEKAKEQGDAMAESAKTRMKCLLIAVRIMSGDDVPAADYRYLAKNDLELYSKAVSMRITKENPKKHKRLSEDEEPSGKDGATNAGGAEGGQPEIGKIQTETSADVSADLEAT